MLDRIFRAIRLDATVFKQVASDEKYNLEATAIAVLVALLAGLGQAVGARTAGRSVVAFLVELGSSLLLGWLLWAGIAYVVGRMLGGSGALGGMTRALAFAGAPRFLLLLGFIPCVGWIFRVAAWLLTLVAGVIAIRETMGFDTLKAVVTAVLGLFVYVAASILLGIFFFAPVAALTDF
jgi:Yip1 domain